MHGISLITAWLPKFKDWIKTSDEGKRVTVPIKKRRAKKIAEILGDASKWHSHGRSIHIMNELGGTDIKLLIDDFGAGTDLSGKIKHYHGLAVDYFFKKMGVAGYIHCISCITISFVFTRR